MRVPASLGARVPIQAGVALPMKKMCIRDRLSDAEIEALYYSAGHYVRLKDDYLAGAAG